MQRLSFTEFFTPRTCVPLLLFAALCLTLPIYINGVPKGNDLQQHFQFALTFYNSILAGDFLPSLSTDTNFGFGDVGVRFYPPLSYYVLAGLKIATGSWHSAAVFAFVTWFFLGGLGIYLWCRDLFSESASLIAAVAYMIVPYHVNEVYNASFFAEFAGAAVLPFCFLFLSRVCKNSSLGNIAGLGFAYSVLILTHLPTALIGSTGLLVYGVCSLKRTGFLKTSASLVGAVMLGLLLSSFYWIKVVTELPFVNHAGPDFVARAYDFKFNFVASYFYVPADAYNDRFLWMTDLMLILAVGLFLPSFLFAAFRYKEGFAKLIPATAVFVLGIFFATPISGSVWENVSILQKIQFPFRWMLLINVAGAFLVAAGFKAVSSAFNSSSRPFALIAFGLMAISGAFSITQVIRPALFIDKDGFDAYVERLSGEQSYQCWLPVWAKESAFANKVPITGSRVFSIVRWDKYEKEFRFSAGPEESVRLALFYYPHWRVKVHDQVGPATRYDEGTISVPLPSEDGIAKLYFDEPSIVGMAIWISALSWLFLFISTTVLLALGFYKYVNSNSDPESI